MRRMPPNLLSRSFSLDIPFHAGCSSASTQALHRVSCHPVGVEGAGSLTLPSLGDFVEVRSRPWLVEGVEDKGQGLFALKLSCISDDAQGESLEIAWDAEIG